MKKKVGVVQERLKEKSQSDRIEQMLESFYQDMSVLANNLINLQKEVQGKALRRVDAIPDLVEQMIRPIREKMVGIEQKLNTLQMIEEYETREEVEEPQVRKTPSFVIMSKGRKKGAVTLYYQGQCDGRSAWTPNLEWAMIMERESADMLLDENNEDSIVQPEDTFYHRPRIQRVVELDDQDGGTFWALSPSTKKKVRNKR